MVVSPLQRSLVAIIFVGAIFCTITFVAIHPQYQPQSVCAKHSLSEKYLIFHFLIPRVYSCLILCLIILVVTYIFKFQVYGAPDDFGFMSSRFISIRVDDVVLHNISDKVLENLRNEKLLCTTSRKLIENYTIECISLSETPGTSFVMSCLSLTFRLLYMTSAFTKQCMA